MPDKDDKLIWEALTPGHADAEAHGSEEKNEAMSLIKLYSAMEGSGLPTLKFQDIMIDRWENIIREKGQKFADMVLNHVLNSGFKRVQVDEILGYYRVARGRITQGNVR